MERFLAFVVAGGIALVAGLWLADLAAQESALRIVGVVAAFAGVAGLGAGIWTELTV